MSTDNEYIEYTDEQKPARKGKGVKIFTALLMLLLAGSIAAAYFLFRDSDTAKAGLKNANGQIAKLQKQVNDLRTELDTTIINLNRERTTRSKIQHDLDTLKTMYPIHVTKLEVANADGRGNSISAFGKDISASSSMYLMPRVTYLGLKVGEPLELMVRLYDSEGKLVTGATSPKGYSYSCKINTVMPGENAVSLSGWGGADRGHFKAGTYRYEVWYDDMCLKQCVFNLK